MFFHGVRQLSVDLRFHELAPLPCKFPSVGLQMVAVSITTCLLKARLSQDLVFVVLSCVGRHVVELLSGHPRPSRVRTPVYVGGPAWTDRSVTKEATLVCVLDGVVASCVLCARVPRVLRDVLTTGCISCATGICLHLS